MTRDDLIFGRKPVIEMLERGDKPDKIFVQSGIDASFLARLRALARALDIHVQTVPWQKLKSLTRANHQGVVAIKAWVQYLHVRDVVSHLFEQGVEPCLLMLDHITDVRNMGAIARSAEVFGVHGIILPATGSAPINGEAVKASAGALLRLAICRERSLFRTLEELHDLGLTSYAADIHAELELPDVGLKGPAVILLGSEETGIGDTLLENVHRPFRIPQAGETESLNVSVAAGIILYQMMLQNR
jgi:23S rRNA (guanosine2251-2'-O)-methyltransferase